MPQHKFLIVGCGGSGGVTLRLMMDQLRADLRAQGISSLPKAWQFVHIDAPVVPDSGPAPIPRITDLGGRYVAVSSPQNTYASTWNQVSNRVQEKRRGAGLIGWSPRDPRDANSVPVGNGAGQYRAIGRMLALPYLKNLQDQLTAAYSDLQQPDAWGELNGPQSAPVIPMVISSMAGGAGAGVFLDACRVLARLPGIDPANLGVFLYTPDIFHQLPDSARSGVEANALGSLTESLAMVARTGEDQDDALYDAMGLGSKVGLDVAPLARVFPVGSLIGGDGATFGDGSMTGIYRGMARALAAIMGSDKAADDYVARKVANPTPVPVDLNHLGWGQSESVFPWGSMGYASLSLGRDRYEEYAAQRIARFSVDHLREGHKDQGSQLPDVDQLNQLVDNQWPYVLQRTGLGGVGMDVGTWFVNVAYPEPLARATAETALAEVIGLVRQDSGQPLTWLSTVRNRTASGAARAGQLTASSVYSWSVQWADSLESAIRAEFVEASAQHGLPYARELMRRLRVMLDQYLTVLRNAGSHPGNPTALDPSLDTKAKALKKTLVTPNHQLVTEVVNMLLRSGRDHAQRVAAAQGADVLASFAQDVLPALESAASDALLDLEHATSRKSGESGLATLATTNYQEWPTESPIAPPKFDHAFNEVLVTTSKDFPAQFELDAVTDVTAAGGVYQAALKNIRKEVLQGRWETTGGARGEMPVLTQQATWRAPTLGHDPATNQPTPASKPRYKILAGTGDVLGRARMWLDRPGPFRTYARQSMHAYLNDPHVPESEQVSRREGFVQRFKETMHLARPLVGVNTGMVQALHGGRPVVYEYAFSEMSLSRNDPTAEQIRALLSNDAALEESTADNFARSLVAEDAPSGSGQRVAVFGSYSKYSPLVYSSLLRPIKQRWDSGNESYLQAVAQWKRTRPLPAAIGMSPEELQAVIAGWYLGRALGLVRQPASVKERNGLAVYHLTSRRWLPIQHLLISRDRQVLAPTEWLPAVLASHGLAMVMCNEDPTMSALAPYRQLREYFDDNSNTPQLGSVDLLRATTLIEEWYGGAWPTGTPDGLLARRVEANATPQDRKDAMLAWLDNLIQPMDQILDPSGEWPIVEHVAQAPQLDMFKELAPIIRTSLLKLRECAEAAQLSVQQVGPTSMGGGWDDV